MMSLNPQDLQRYFISPSLALWGARAGWAWLPALPSMGLGHVRHCHISHIMQDLGYSSPTLVSHRAQVGWARVVLASYCDSCGAEVSLVWYGYFPPLLLHEVQEGWTLPILLFCSGLGWSGCCHLSHFFNRAVTQWVSKMLMECFHKCYDHLVLKWQSVSFFLKLKRHLSFFKNLQYFRFFCKPRRL